MGYETQKDGSLAVQVDVGGKQRPSSPTCVLVAVGMRPNRGPRPREGRRQGRARLRPHRQVGRTNVPSIYAIGDVSGPPMLAHKATKEGEVVAEVIAGHKAAKDWVAIPARHLHRSRDRHAASPRRRPRRRASRSRVGKFPFAALGRAMAVNETEGFVKVVADKKTNQVLGVHIVGPEASDLISEARSRSRWTRSSRTSGSPSTRTRRSAKR